MAARSTRITFRNQTGETLRLIDESLSHGEWTEPLSPPGDIAPGQTVAWQSESAGFATSTVGRASPRGAPHPRIWLPVNVATFVTIAAAIAVAIVLAEETPSGVDASSQLPRDAIGEAGPLFLIDHSIVESKSLADEPDMTGASVGAYGR